MGLRYKRFQRQLQRLGQAAQTVDGNGDAIIFHLLNHVFCRLSLISTQFPKLALCVAQDDAARPDEIAEAVGWCICLASSFLLPS